MVEILAWEDIKKVQDPQVKKYLEYTKQKVSRHLKPWNFKDWGYWVVIEQKEELEKPLKGTYFSLPSLKEGLLDNLEVYEERYGISELLIMLDNDRGIGLLIKNEHLTGFEKEALETFKSFSAETTTEKN